MLFIDCDNGLGSQSGDVDDGFALLSLLVNRTKIGAIIPVSGNVSMEESFRNSKDLLRDFGAEQITVFPLENFSSRDQAEAVRLLLEEEKESYRILALGPLTNLKEVGRSPIIRERLQELVIVGSDTKSMGSFPPFWPFEFNLVKDRSATFHLLRTNLPFTLFPLNVARSLAVPFKKITMLPEPIASYLVPRVERWWKRSHRLYWKKDVPIWDLAAASYCSHPELFQATTRYYRVQRNGHVKFGCGNLKAKTIESFNPEMVWERFVADIEDFLKDMKAESALDAKSPRAETD